MAVQQPSVKGFNLVGTKLPGGFSIQQDNKLLFPYYLRNTNADREIISREAIFSFPLAAVGLLAGGLPGVLIGHIVGAAIGYYRNEALNIKPSRGFFFANRINEGGGIGGLLKR